MFFYPCIHNAAAEQAKEEESMIRFRAAGRGEAARGRRRMGVLYAGLANTMLFSAV